MIWNLLRIVSGTVAWVELDIGDAAGDLDHLIAPEECFQLAMAKQ